MGRCWLSMTRRESSCRVEEANNGDFIPRSHMVPSKYCVYVTKDNGPRLSPDDNARHWPTRGEMLKSWCYWTQWLCLHLRTLPINSNSHASPRPLTYNSSSITSNIPTSSHLTDYRPKISRNRPLLIASTALIEKYMLADSIKQKAVTAFSYWEEDRREK